MHEFIDFIQGVNTDFIDKVQPIGAAIILSGIGLVTGWHIASITLSMGYTCYCWYLKHKQNKNKPQ